MQDPELARCPRDRFRSVENSGVQGNRCCGDQLGFPANRVSRREYKRNQTSRAREGLLKFYYVISKVARPRKLAVMQFRLRLRRHCCPCVFVPSPLPRDFVVSTGRSRKLFYTICHRLNVTFAGLRAATAVWPELSANGSK